MQTGTRWNQTTHNHVFFQAAQIVAFAHDGSFGQDTGSLLERCGRDERIGRQRRFGNTQQDVFDASRLFAFCQHFLVFNHHFGALNLLTSDEVGITRIGDVHTTQHLANDHFNVFVGNLHTLQAVNLLHFLDDVASQGFDTLQTQDVVRINRAIDNGFTTVHHLTIVHQNLFFFRNQGFYCDAVGIGDDQALFAFGFFTEGNSTRHFCQHTCVFWCTCLEQFCYARQTTGNVTGFGRGLWDTRQYITFANFLTFTHGDDCTDRECHGHWGVRTWSVDFFTVFIKQAHCWTQYTRL